MNQHAAVVAAVIDEPELAEFVHEVADPRPGCSDHSRQCFLTDLWNHRLQLAFLAKVRKQKQNPSQPLLARIEQLIDQVLFNSNIAGEQVGREERRVFWVVGAAGLMAFLRRRRHDRSSSPQEGHDTAAEHRPKILGALHGPPALPQYSN